MASDINHDKYLEEQQARHSAECLLEEHKQALETCQQELTELKANFKEIVETRTQEAFAASITAQQANRAKSQFLANMSHEIRTPLTAIIGFAEIIQREKPNAEVTDEYLTTIIDNGNHLTELLSEILDLSNIETNNLPLDIKRFDLLLLLKELNDLYQFNAQSKSITLTFDLKAGIPQWIESDPIRFKQVLHNLLSNAFKFTDQGQITLSAKTHWNTGMLVFKVKDSGEGIADAQRQYIFDSFKQADARVTRKHGGTGLGLSIAKSLLQLLGGELTVESELNVGSEFTASIQSRVLEGKHHTLASSAQKSAAIENDSIPQLAGEVLLVEDTLTNQQIISRYVECTGAKVTLANNGQLGIEQAISHEFDLILMDIQMPVMDGKEALKGLLQLGYSKPVYALTANVMQKDIEEYAQIGFKGTLAKPLDLSKLLEVLELHLTKTNQRPSKKDVLTTLAARTEKLKPLFFKTLKTQYQQLLTLVNNGEYVDTDRILHVIKGSAGSFGYDELTNTANDALVMLRQQRLDEATTCINQIMTQVDHILSIEVQSATDD